MLHRFRFPKPAVHGILKIGKTRVLKGAAHCKLA